jgi:transcriptional regulator of acetoin/glycerol metabolism
VTVSEGHGNMEISAVFSRHRERVLSVVAGEEKECSVPARIYQSWRRCYSKYGLDPTHGREPEIVERHTLREHQERLGTLLPIARVEMANLYQQVAGSGHSILLTDDSGMILNYVGDPSFDSTATNSGLKEGALWSEQQQGTNGMGTCLAEQQALIVHRNEHFLASNLGLTCTASPIFDPTGKILAVLNASSEYNKAQQHTLALVNMSAKTIENRAFLGAFKNHFIMHFHSRPEFVNTLGEGLMAFRTDGAILAANQSALVQIGWRSPAQLRGQKIDEIFDLTRPSLLQHPAYSSLHAIPIHEAKQGRRFFAIVQRPEPETPSPRSVQSTVSTRISDSEGSGDAEPLSTLEFGDPRMAQNIRISRRVLDKGIPFLLCGESGTGKGVFAKAVHQSSARAGKPFVPIDCASIPESLIESELFGYKAGAFTGASRHGSPGKIVQANGGTLFLDEIGDMPLSLQARLLRVLEEKEVVPLGSHHAVSVDLWVISATHRDLSEMLAEGSFREDLYYRLQGVRVTLPPLRERTDKLNLVHHLIREEVGPDSCIQVEEAVLNRLISYSWPGNIRQLRNVLRTLIALRESDHITVNDLVDDLFRDAHLKEERPQGSPAACDEVQDPLLCAEREALLHELELCRWNVSTAARHLKLSRNTLYRKMKRCNITPTR